MNLGWLHFFWCIHVRDVDKLNYRAPPMTDGPTQAIGFGAYLVTSTCSIALRWMKSTGMGFYTLEKLRLRNIIAGIVAVYPTIISTNVIDPFSGPVEFWVNIGATGGEIAGIGSQFETVTVSHIWYR